MSARVTRAALVILLGATLGCSPEPRRAASGPRAELRWYRDLAIDDMGGDLPAMHVDPGGGLWVAVAGLAEPRGRSRVYHRPPGGAFRLVHEGSFASELSLSSVRAGEVYLGYNQPLDAFRPTLVTLSADGSAPRAAPDERVDALEYLQIGGYAMMSDRDGFACGQHGSLFRLSSERWIREPPVLPFHPGDPAAKSFCRSIRLDGPRRGLLADWDGQGAAWDGERWRLLARPPGLDVLSPANGLGREGSALFRLEGEHWIRLDGELPSAAAAVFDTAGRWAMHPSGAVAIEPRRLRPLPGRLPFTPRAVEEADGALWALGSDGLYRSTRRDVATFAPPAAGAPPPGLVHAIAVDLDQDGDEDLLGLAAPPGEVSGGRAALVALINDGAGHFSAPSLGLPDDVFLWRDHFDVGDLDGDGDVDVVSVTSGGRIEIWMQDAGRFSRTWSRPAEEATVALADVDGDGDLDLSAIPATPGLWLNDGTGTFEEGPAIPLPSARTERAIWADVDGDGDLDAVLQHWRDPAHLLLNDGKGRFTLTQLSVVAEGATASDVDLDGITELLAQKIHLRGMALPFARCRVQGGACVAGEGPAIPAGLVVDLNLDGRKDVIVTDLRGDEVTPSDGEVYLASPDGLAYERITEITGPMPRPTAIDADGDGDPDVYSAPLGLRVNTSDPASFVRVHPRASRSDRLARGAMVVARRAGEAAIVASARADTGVATLGLPDPGARYDIEVRFPAGERRVATGLAAGTDLVVRDAGDVAFQARLARLWASGTARRGRPLRDLVPPAALWLLLAMAIRRMPRRLPRMRAALPIFGAAWLGLSGVLLRAPGAAPWLLTPLSAAVAAAGQGAALIVARRRAALIAGPYFLEERLGAGAAATVWRARTGRRRVALKLFSAEAMASTESRERFFREARVGSEIRHPNVVRIHDAGELDDGRCYLAMELVPGRSLAAILRETKRLPAREAAAIGIDTARALAALHEAGIVHRDVKPENLLVRPDGSAVLTDLGLARSALFKTLTRHDVAVGTLAYMSPEQCVGRPLDGRTDVWSLGATLYEALTGHRPFAGGHELELVYAIHNLDPAPPSSLAPGVPVALDEAILRCLRRDPDDRFAGAQDLEAALASAVPGDGGAGACAEPFPPGSGLGHHDSSDPHG